jgi:predicted transposase YdaD
LDINDYFANKALAEKYAFNINLIDLSKLSDEELQNHGIIAGLELIIKHITARNIDYHLEKVTRYMIGYDGHIKQTLIKYMSRYSDLEKQTFYDKLISSEPNLKGDVMTVAQQWLEQGKSQGIQEGLEKGILQGIQQGKQEGILQGMQQGELNAKKTTALNFLRMGLSYEQVANGTGLSIKDVEELSKTIKQ